MGDVIHLHPRLSEKAAALEAQILGSMADADPAVLARWRSLVSEMLRPNLELLSTRPRLQISLPDSVPDGVQRQVVESARASIEAHQAQIESLVGGVLMSAIFALRPYAEMTASRGA